MNNKISIVEFNKVQGYLNDNNIYPIKKSTLKPNRYKEKINTGIVN